MRYHSKGYQQGLQGWPTYVRLSTTCISYVYYSLTMGLCSVTTNLCSLKTSEYVSTLEKNNPQFSVEESALIPLVRFFIGQIFCIRVIFLNLFY
jgi:hypothetical protein